MNCNGDGLAFLSSDKEAESEEGIIGESEEVEADRELETFLGGNEDFVQCIQKSCLGT